MYEHEKAGVVAWDTSPAKPRSQTSEVPPAGLLNSVSADLCSLTDMTTVALRELRELRHRTLGAWPEDGCSTGIGREPSSKSEELANIIGALRAALLDVRDQASYLNREI